MNTVATPLAPSKAAAHGGPWRPSTEALWTTASVLTLLGIWSVASWFLPPAVLPSPWLVVQAMAALVQTQELWTDTAVTLGRIALAFAIGMGAAILLGSAMAMSRRAGVFFRVWIVCGITVPAIVTILTVYMVVGMNDRGAVLGAALTVIPFLAINIREGLKNLDTRLLQMGKVFRASRGQVVRSIIAPQVAPMLLASARFGLGLVWKMVLFVELLGRGDGVGFRIEYYFQLFDMTSVLAYAMCFVLVMLAIEVGIFGWLEKRAFRWRQG
ncbi:ABC transporter permease [Hydrogenophaga laconesensis]|uniref:NitT/TauT family transport system permease protein n=1 Tax=Hydrogenophaga laconesensis TaxID=1805971 RepID=A0ABU1V7U9_9BURK|nr:ABC transporter permease subunit [Hydrogenophaga laconesensis]MDR7093535.1 NitT/TauT family transport system permease protein [Hydrogenophaga laconesensis]